MEPELDPRLAFQALQELHGMEMSRLAGELATKSAEAYQLRQELNKLQERITALEQNEEVRNGGADLKSLDLQPKSPMKKVADGR